jgi:nitrate/nitrite transporter NarK
MLTYQHSAQDVYVATDNRHAAAGLLSTQSGSLGRLVGNFSIAIFGGIVVGTVSLANVMFLVFFGFVLVCLATYALSYSKLQRTE